MVRERVVDHVEVADTFEGLLRQAGFTDRSEYAQEEFRHLRTRWFSVTAEFPRLQRSKLPQAISAGKYRLLLENLEAFETSWET